MKVLNHGLNWLSVRFLVPEVFLLLVVNCVFIGSVFAGHVACDVSDDVTFLSFDFE